MSHSATATTEYQPLISASFIRKATLVIFALAAITLALSLAGRWMGERIAMGGHSVSTTPSQIKINGETLLFPANAIRFENQRAGGSMERLDLYLMWPRMEGYSTANRRYFNDVDYAEKMIFLTISPQTMPIDMSHRLIPVYKRLIEPPGVLLPSGLARYPFARDTRYIGEQLYVGDRPGQLPFVVRCMGETDIPAGSRNCMRDINFGNGLTVEYRFSEKLLPSWKDLDAAIFSYAVAAKGRDGA